MCISQTFKLIRRKGKQSLSYHLNQHACVGLSLHRKTIFSLHPIFSNQANLLYKDQDLVMCANQFYLNSCKIRNVCFPLER